MKKIFSASVLLAAIALLSPATGKAQGFSCPAGFTSVTNSDGSITCSYTYRAPEISASSSVGGIAVLMCGAIMLRRRKHAGEVL
jgi:hypothetical protein